MTFKKILFTAAMLTAIANAHAAGSAPFGVTGTITPGACNVTLTNGVATIGTLTNTAVKAYGVAASSYALPGVPIPISIICTAATKVAVSFIDNLVGKKVAINADDGLRFGMVDGAGTTAIGAYQLHFTSLVVDTVTAVQPMSSVTGSTAWSTSTLTQGAIFAAPGYTTAFSKTTGAVIPDAFTTLTGTLSMEAFLSTAYVGAATTAITPTGSGTLSLVYL